MFKIPYIGRFAPSPSGRLHFGSLVSALGSYLRARSLNGKILLRIEDLDFYRCKDEYTKAIIKELKVLGFEYDNDPYIQSKHQDIYREYAQKLLDKRDAYYCKCTREDLKHSPCKCKFLHLVPNDKQAMSLRYEVDTSITSFEDSLLGTVISAPLVDNFTLIRKDKVIAYNLACVVDDALEGVTEVVRGSDLIDITTSQISLYRSFNFAKAKYLHLPLAMENSEFKLSKQNKAKAILDIAPPSVLLKEALEFLGQETSFFTPSMTPSQILDKAISNFNLKAIPTMPKLCPSLFL